MFEELEKLNSRPRPFEYYTANDLWADEHTSKQMLSFHLNGEIDVSSRKTSFIDISSKWISSLFNVGTGIKIADFGCGPGLYTTRLAKKGAVVTGIDFSKRSIQYAREAAIREGLSIHYVNRDYLEFETEDRFALILMIMCDLCALSPTQRRKMLSKFHAFLEPGGYLLLDAYSLKAFEKREETVVYEANLLNGFWSPDKYYGFLNTFKYEREKVVLDKYTIVEANRTRTVYNWLQYFKPEELKREFEDYGFELDGLYSDAAGSTFDPESEEFAVVIHKIG